MTLQQYFDEAIQSRTRINKDMHVLSGLCIESMRLVATTAGTYFVIKTTNGRVFRCASGGGNMLTGDHEREFFCEINPEYE